MRYISITMITDFLSQTITEYGLNQTPNIIPMKTNSRKLRTNLQSTQYKKYMRLKRTKKNAADILTGLIVL